MAFKIVRTGRELEIREAFAYLERMYDMPADHIKSLTVIGTVGEPMAITVTVIVQEEPAPDPLEDVNEVGEDGSQGICIYEETRRTEEGQWKAPRIS